METETIKAFLDEDGKVKVWPSKRAKQLAVLEYLAHSFEAGRDYTEKEVNAILMAAHTFGDFFLLRRELVEAKELRRTIDGARYWRE